MNDPVRFAGVCPALTRTPAGLRCQHAATEVRPYWLRAFGIVFGIILLGYTTLATTWFGFLRYRGFDQVTWTDCYWPGHWQNIATARGAFFRTQAQQALRRYDFGSAMRSLSSGFASCPDCWADGLLLARLYEHVGQFAAADQLVATLVERFPIHRETIVINHHDAMLASQRFSDLHQFAWDNLLAGDPAASSWFVPLVLTASESYRGDRLWIDREEEIERLTPEHRSLLAIAVTPPGRAPAFVAEQALRSPSQSPLTARLRWELFLRKGNLAAANASIRLDSAILSPFEGALAQWATLDPRVSDRVYAQFWARVIPEDITSSQIERICAVALLVPRSPPLFQLRIRIADEDAAALAALWVVASMHGNTSLAGSLMVKLNLDPNNPLHRLMPATARSTLRRLAPVVPIPREVHYALVSLTAPMALPD